MKSYLLVLTTLFLCFSSWAQSAQNYQSYTNRITKFSKPARILHNNVNAQGNGNIEFINPKNQILRFRLNNHKVQPGSCQIAFEIYYYENKYLNKIESYDINGNLIGCDLKLDGEAVTQFIIEKPTLYLKKKKLIDDADGNIEMNDTKEKIIRVLLFDANNRPILKLQPAYISSKEFWQYNSRMSWP